MRIVHFSDIHLAAWPAAFTALFDKRILGLLNYTLRRRLRMHESYVQKAVEHIHKLKPDFVICSGDLTCIGSPPEFSKARRALATLAESEEIDFFYVPGNHDAYINASSNWKALEAAFYHLNRQRWHLKELPVLEKSRKLEFMLVNECQPTPVWGSYGFFQGETRESFAKWLAETPLPDRLRILVGHFPTRRESGQPLERRRMLRGNGIVREALESGKLDVSLCGHIHDPYVNRFASGALEICSGSLTAHGYINVLDIDDDGSVKQRWDNVKERKGA